MVRRRAPLALLLALSLAGCLPDKETVTVPSNPFSTEPVPPLAQVSYAPASEELAKHVGLIGQKLLVANPQLGVRPLFRTVGVPQAEVFHRGTTEIILTEGLAKQCSDGQLAGVLATELGKMVAEREAQTDRQVRTPDREPPPPLFIGGDSSSSRGPADMTYQAELAPYDRQRRRATSPPPPPPDPQVLARNLLQKAGYSTADLQASQPLLQAAAENMTLEKQLGAPAATRPWTR